MRQITGDFERGHIPTPSIVHSPKHVMHTSRGDMNIILWDTPSDNRDSEAEGYDACLHRAQGVFIFFDVCDRSTFQSIARWKEIVDRTFIGPVVLCGNKIDKLPQEVTTQQAEALHIDYVCLSTRSNAYLDQPLLTLLRKIVDDPSLSLVEPPSLLMPPPPPPPLSGDILSYFNGGFLGTR
eukprot:TRINITY_DN15690_c0_g1_i1.p1 TRINITY_DN15690_c0_g1~~TRINITY_DN15690_c0_g1_i1.p1  ORF type:complete len:181 (-),score=27.28 TRINITY_DN15690_c0_g1_i1:87-629(-)